MSFRETDTEVSASSPSEESSLDDDFEQLHLDSQRSDDEVTDEEMDSTSWSEIESDSDAEFLEDHGLVEEVTPTSGDNTILPIDCYRHFVTDELINLMVRETNRYAEQCLQTHQISRHSSLRQWKPTTCEEMLKFLGIIIEMGLVQMPKLSYYWSSSQL